MNRTQLIATIATIPVPVTEFDRSGSRHQTLTEAALTFGDAILAQVPENDARSAVLHGLAALTRDAVAAIAPAVPLAEPRAEPEAPAPADEGDTD